MTLRRGENRGEDIMPNNPPKWMLELSPELMSRAARIAARLIEDGYSEEQAYEIALERLQEEDESEDEAIDETAESNDIYPPI